MDKKLNSVKSDDFLNDNIEHINVMVVDDDAIIRDGLNSLLLNDSKIKVKAQASSGEEAIQLLEQHDIDIILMDINMPGCGGIEATKIIMLQHPKMKVLALSAYNDEAHPSEIIHMGARGYLTKGVNFKEMCEAIHTVHHGEKYLCSAISNKVRNNLNLGRDLIFDHLTSREMMVCKEIIFGSSLEDIASKAGITAKEAKSLKATIFGKLHIDNDIALMHLAIRNGLIDQA
jgi:two-component system invasion response regulator UvrY